MSLSAACSSAALLLVVCAAHAASAGQLVDSTDASIGEALGMSDVDFEDTLAAEDCPENDCELTLLQQRALLMVGMKNKGVADPDEALKDAMFSDSTLFDDSNGAVQLVQTSAKMHNVEHGQARVIVQADGSTVNVHKEMGNHYGMMQVTVGADGSIEL